MVKTREDITGKKYGFLTVIEQIDDYIDKKGIHYARWKCKCDCGNYKEVIGNSLRQGNVKSCGCYRPQKSISHGENHYELYENYAIGHDVANKSFFIDIDDLERVKKYYWSIDAYGYVNTFKNNTKIKMHRFIMNCKKDDEMVIDHINHNKSDNRKK